MIHTAFNQPGGKGVILDRSRAATNQVWFVQSTHSNASDGVGFGRHPDTPFATLDYLLSNATTLGVTTYDTVVIGPGHNEGLEDDQWACATAGLTIMAHERAIGGLAPVLDFDHANASLDITANNTVWKGIHFRPSIATVAIGVHLATGVTGTEFHDCRWMMGEEGDGTDEFVKALYLQSGNHDTKLVNCTILAHASANGATHGIHVAAASNRLVIKGLVMQGPYATGGWVEAAAGLNHVFEDSSIDVSGAQVSLHASSTFASRKNNELGGKIEEVEVVTTRVETQVTGRGRNFYVDSNNGASGNSGLTWGDAVATIDQAINKCTHDYGDVIHVAANHAETVGGAAAIDCDVRSITIRGYGNGLARPTLTFDTNTDTLEIAVIDVTLENLYFLSDVADLAKAVDIAAGGDNCTIRNCLFRDGAANKEMLVAINVAAAANNLLIEGCEFSTTASGDCTDAILLAGACDNTVIRDCIFNGDWSSGCVDGSGAAQTHLTVKDCVMNNVDASAGLCINLHGSSTGIVTGNRCHGGLTGTDPIVCAAAMRLGNLVTVVEGTDALAELGIQCVRATGALAQTGVLSLFTITGRVMVTAIIGEVTTNIQNQANATKLSVNPTAGDTTDICATLDIANDQVGTLYGITGTAGDAMQQACIMKNPIIAEAGVIEMNCAANNSGAIQWNCYWKPLVAGSTLVANGP